ncbi:MAG: sortase [Patescibacteria group bacterium]
MKIRFASIFAISFVVIFGLLNIRFVGANIRYLAAPGTIIRDDSLAGIPTLFPLADDISQRPLPSNARLVIDRLGVDAPIVFDVPPKNNDIYARLEDGVVHYNNSVKPGQDGIAIVLGHSSAYPWYRGQYGSVFALLGKLNPGERFYVRYEDGRTFIFEMKKSIVFNPFADDARLTELEQTNTPSLVLLSCWPVGTNYRRIAVYAERVFE